MRKPEPLNPTPSVWFCTAASGLVLADKLTPPSVTLPGTYAAAMSAPELLSPNLLILYTLVASCNHSATVVSVRGPATIAWHACQFTFNSTEAAGKLNIE
jgi:hypothetical protein